MLVIDQVDACKHMWPEDLDYIFDRVNNLDTRWFPANTQPYMYQEVGSFDSSKINLIICINNNMNRLFVVIH